MDLIASMSLVAVDNATVFEAVKRYLELEAASLIAGGDAWRDAMRRAEHEAVETVTRYGGVVRLGLLTVESHVSFEGERELGRWITIKGPAAAFSILTDAANTAAHTRLRVPWRRGIHIETTAYELGRQHSIKRDRKQSVAP